MPLFPAGYTLPGPAWAPESPVEVSAFVMHDENAMNVFAPTGLGIFYDPAKLRLRARTAAIFCRISSSMPWGWPPEGGRPASGAAP